MAMPLPGGSDARDGGVPGAGPQSRPARQESAPPAIDSSASPLPFPPHRELAVSDARCAPRMELRLVRAQATARRAAPSQANEAVRDVCRAWVEATDERAGDRHRLNKFLSCKGLAWTGGKKAGHQAKRAWLTSLSFPHVAEQILLDSYLSALDHAERHVAKLKHHVADLARQDAHQEAVDRLSCFHGIDATRALCIVTELQGFERFTSARQLMSYVGLTPGRKASGSKTLRSTITKAGNPHARRAFIEAATQYGNSPGISKALRERREGKPLRAIAIANRAQRRLESRAAHLAAQGKDKKKISVALARELVGFVWAALSSDGRDTGSGCETGG